jgi:DNA-binding CsgD family transcriptional regulator
MFRLTVARCLVMALWLMAALSSCRHDDPNVNDQQTQGKYATQIKTLIATGRRVESVNNDSLKIEANQLYQLYKLSQDKSALVWAELFDADYYWQNGDHKQAMQLSMKCLADAERFNIKQANIQIYGTIANLHKETGNFIMAFKNADIGLQLSIANKDTAHMIALLGLKAMFTRSVNLSKNKPGPDSSIALNLAALRIAESSPKYEKMRTRFYDNICQYYKDQRDYAKAYYYGNKGVALALKFNHQRSLTYSFSWLGQSYYFQGNHEKGIGLLNKALEIATTLKEPYRVMEIHEHIYDCYISSNDYKNALVHYRRTQTMRDSLKVVDNGNKLSELQVKYETAQKDKEITALNYHAKIGTLQRNAVIVILTLVVIIIALTYLKERERKELVLSEKLRVDEELKSASLELQYFTENLKQKNEVIEEFKAEIEHLHLKNITAADKEGLDNLINAHIMTDENWDSFRKLFSKVHVGFFEDIKRKYPHLTVSDARILSLIKLELSNSEMANMLGITIEGIKKSKQRLRKKMDLNKDDVLESIVSDI